MKGTERPNPYYMFAGLLLIIGFGALAMSVCSQPSNLFDITVAAFVQSFVSPGLTQVMEIFTLIGSPKSSVIIAAGIMAFLFFVLRHRAELLFFCAALGGAAVLNSLLKEGFHRERPTVLRLIEESGYSFPSGHAIGAFALYGALAYLLWRHVSTRRGRSLLLSVCGFVILMICLSRVYLGVNYPSDIIGALLASGFWLALVIWLFQWGTEIAKLQAYPAPSANKTADS